MQTLLEVPRQRAGWLDSRCAFPSLFEELGSLTAHGLQTGSYWTLAFKVVPGTQAFFSLESKKPACHGWRSEVATNM